MGRSEMTKIDRLRELNIVALFNNGMRINQIALTYGMPRRQVARILDRYHYILRPDRAYYSKSEQYSRNRAMKRKPWTTMWKFGCRSCTKNTVKHFKMGYCRKCFKRWLPKQYEELKLNPRYIIKRASKRIKSPEAYRLYLDRLKLRLYREFKASAAREELLRRKRYQQELLARVGVIINKDNETSKTQ